VEAAGKQSSGKLQINGPRNRGDEDDFERSLPGERGRYWWRCRVNPRQRKMKAGESPHLPEHNQALRTHRRPCFGKAGCFPATPRRCTPSLHSLDCRKLAASCWPMRRGDLFLINLAFFPAFDTAPRGLMGCPGCPLKPTHPETEGEVPAPSSHHPRW